jgi:hypothetical protein
MTEPTTTFMVVGWIDGKSIYQSCVSFQQAMNIFREIQARNQNAGKWFLEIMIATSELTTNKKGKDCMKFTSFETLKTVGTYDMFFENAEKKVDEQIEGWFK